MSKQIQVPSRGPLKMRDIAALAGVSTATISRVLHNSPLVDPETAANVRTIIRRANYVPNTTGTALKSGHSGIFGLIVPDISNPFFADFVKHFERQLVDRDQEMLLAITDHLPEQMQRSTRRMLMRGVEGVVVLESEIETESYETILHNQVPLVTLNRLMVEPGVSDIAIDALSGMTAAIAHLKKLGHQRIGFLGGILGQRITAARELSFRQAMENNHLKHRSDWIGYANFTLNGGTKAMEVMLAHPNRVTAVLCANDLSAVGALRAIRKARLAPGYDISVIGLDDIDLDTMVDPPLTTLRISRERLATLCLQALTRLSCEPNHPGEQLFLDLELVLRESAGPCPTAMKEKNTQRKTRA